TTHFEHLLDLAIVDSIKEFCSDIAFRIGITQGQFGRGRVDRGDIVLNRKIENRIEQHEIPSLKPILKTTAECSGAAGPLDDVGLMNHRIKVRATSQQIDGCDLSGFAKLLLVPAQIVIKK